MSPIVTMLHFDTPFAFYDFDVSDLANSSLGYVDGNYGSQEFEDEFVHYGKILMTHFADRVSVWFT